MQIFKKKTALLILLGSCVWANAADLKDVIADAKLSDTEYLSSLQTFAKIAQDVKLAQAAWRPSVSLSVQYAHNQQHQGGSEQGKSYTYGLNVNQNLLNFPALRALDKANIAFQQAALSKELAKQQMLFKAASQYFSVLVALSDLDGEKAHVKALKSQYQQIQHQYSAGVVAKPDLFASRAQYRLQQAALMNAKVKLKHEIDALSELTGKKYHSFTLLGSKLPMRKPSPNREKAWEAKAMQHNLALLVAKKSVEVADESVRMARAAGYPVVSAQANFVRSKPWIAGTTTPVTSLSQVVLKAAWNIYNGGQVKATVTQLQHLAQITRHAREQARRAAVSQTRSSFYDIKADVDQLHAAYQALLASKSSASAMREGYKAGTQTLTDVLQSISATHRARLQYTSARYKYLQDILLLKFSVGALEEQDLLQMNQLFKRTVLV